MSEREPGTILIRGGRVLDPARGFDCVSDLLIEEGIVTAIDAGIDPIEGAIEIDASGCLVTPGLVDPHVHLREPGGEHKETIATGTASAVAGGFTTVCCMPNTTPTIDSCHTLEFIRMRALETARCRVFVVAAATLGRLGEEIAPIASLVEAGAVGISDDGDVVADSQMMLDVLRTCAQVDRVFMQHAQDPALTRGASMNSGPTASKLGLIGWPKLAEELIVERDIRMLAQTGGRYHVQHVSSAGTVEILRRAQDRGLAATGEASPHHLLLTDEACDGYDTSAKMNPPLRTADDVEALRKGVADGTLSILATDHAPHTQGEKAEDFETAPFGIVGLDSALGLYAKALVESGHIDWSRLIALLTIEPARLVDLDERGVGRLEVGLPADVTVIDPDMTWQVDPDEFASKGRNTPFTDVEVTGRPVVTIVGGTIAYRLDGAFNA
ncbi:MAG TPA: dihydroorotase [Phycisphaerales bacterium]|nr:dihydroorotase [Phycisphaerales bacterium]